MKVHETMTITKRTVDDVFYGEKNAVPYEIRKSDAIYPEYEGFYNVMRSTPYTDRPRLFEEMMNNNRYPHIFGRVAEVAEEAAQTFDFGVIAAVAALISAAGYALSKKR